MAVAVTCTHVGWTGDLPLSSLLDLTRTHAAADINTSSASSDAQASALHHSPVLLRPDGDGPLEITLRFKQAVTVQSLEVRSRPPSVLRAMVGAATRHAALSCPSVYRAMVVLPRARATPLVELVATHSALCVFFSPVPLKTLVPSECAC